MPKNICEKLNIEHAFKNLPRDTETKFAQKVYDEYSGKRNFSYSEYFHVRKCANCGLENVQAELVYVVVLNKYSDGEVR